MTDKLEKPEALEAMGQLKDFGEDAKNINKIQEAFIDEVSKEIEKKFGKDSLIAESKRNLEFKYLNVDIYIDYFYEITDGSEIVGKIVYGAKRKTAEKPDSQYKSLLEFKINQHGFCTNISGIEGEWIVSKGNKRSILEIHYLALDNIIEEAFVWASSYPGSG